MWWESSDCLISNSGDQLALADRLLAAAQDVEDAYAQRLAERLGDRGDALGVQRLVEADRRRAARGGCGTGGKDRERRGHNDFC